MKRIVICSDGTWNSPDQVDGGKRRPTNVTKMARAVVPRDEQGHAQVIFYDKGVGTSRFDRWIGGAFGFGLEGNVVDAYRFLIHNYEPGDKLYFFGFSRGAYTVRSVVGMIRNCGLLKKLYADRFPEAYDLYSRRDSASAPGEEAAKDFRADFSHEPRIHFIGVWDTVGALGIPLQMFNRFNKKMQFHDVDLTSWVDNAYHALAIDERRKPFKPSLWNQRESAKQRGQQMEQRWFAGVHSNVGGGYADTGLSDIAFEWMADKARDCGLALKLNDVAPPVDPQHLGAIRNSMTWFYRLLGKLIRPIDQTVDKSGKKLQTNETVAPEALARLGNERTPYRKANEATIKEVPYDPPNLREYVERERG